MSIFTASQPVVRSPGGGTRLQVLGESITLLVSGNDTRGAFTMISETTPSGASTPLQVHYAEDMALYVLEGQYEIRCGAETFRTTAGSFVFVPRGIPHQLTNVSAEPSKLLGIVSPAGFEGFWEEVSRLPSPPVPETILAIASKYRWEILAP